MTVYMVFEPPETSGDAAERAERIAFVRDRFTWGAFLFAPLWMLWHQLWLVLAGYLIVMAALGGGLWYAGVGIATLVAILAPIAFLIGLEAASLRRWTLRQQNWRELGTVIGDDIESAERRFFDVWTAQSERKSAPPLPPAPQLAMRPASPTSDVIGLFPQPGATR